MEDNHATHHLVFKSLNYFNKRLFAYVAFLILEYLKLRVVSTKAADNRIYKQFTHITVLLWLRKFLMPFKYPTVRFSVYPEHSSRRIHFVVLTSHVTKRL